MELFHIRLIIATTNLQIYGYRIFFYNFIDIYDFRYTKITF